MTFSFGEEVLHASVYVKLLAPDQLLLSEIVLGIVNYHPKVKAIPRCTVTSLTFTKSEAKRPVEAQVETQVENIGGTVTPIPEITATRKKGQTNLPEESRQGSKLDTQTALDKTNVVVEKRPENQTC